jgi:alpha-tubulin suppressor-like RCC1 family protein
VTIIMASSCSNNWSFSEGVTLGAMPPNSGQSRVSVYDYGTDEFDLWYDGDQGQTSSAVNEEAIHTVSYNRDSGATNFYLRGAYNGYANTWASDLCSGIIVGQGPYFSSAYYGNISEVLVYNRVLSDTERNQAEGYLADQYGLYQPNATWPLAFSGDVQALISENDWTEAEANAYVSSLGSAVLAPDASPTPGRYSSTQTVTVSSSTSDATIYYTTDGTTPTTSSTSVSNGGVITVSSTTELRLLASDGILPDSPITTAVYQIGNSGLLVAGDSFSMALRPDGTVWTWGDNGRGQQGDNQAENPAVTPREVPGLSGLLTVAAAGDHALAVTSDGSVWAWGADDQSQCGDGGTSDLYNPTELSGLSNIVAVTAGQENGFAVDSSGNLYGWGNNDNGQLGDGTTNPESTPESITSVTNVVKVVSNPNFTMALKSDGTVWATGQDGAGEQGDGTYNNETAFQQVPGLSNVVDVAIGGANALALKSDGTIWAWGNNWDGELADGNFNPGINYPQQVLGVPRAVAVTAVNGQCFALLTDGTLRSWGGNWQGNLGMGAGNVNSQDTPIQPPGVQNVVAVAAGTYHTIVCTTSGAIYGWGDNSSYRVGPDLAQDYYNTPNEVHDLDWEGFTGVSSAENSTLGLKSDGTVWAVGEGDNGVLGQGDWYPTERPIATIGLSNVVSLATGVQSAFAICNDGSLWVWGANWDGQLGIGNYNAQNSPTNSTGLSGVTSVAGGDNHMLAIQSDGTVWASGDDSQGELGDGTTNTETSPIQVTGFTDPVQVAAGNNTSFVLQSDGSVWAWGQNDSGQLGLGQIGNVATPTQVTDLPPMIAISVHEQNGVGIDTSGNVWNWGPVLGNSDGTPLEQTGVSNVTAVAAGSYHDLAISSDGTLWGNGADWNGQLGGTFYSTSSFVQFSGVSGATAVAANYATSLVLRQDNSIASFGNFNNGEQAANMGIYTLTPQPLLGFAMSETAPSVSISSPSSDASESTGTAIDFQATATASTGSIVEVDYYLNGVEIGTSTAGGTWDLNWTPTTYGQMTFEAVATDSAGITQVSAPLVLTITQGTSAPGSLTVTSGPSGTVYLGWGNSGPAPSSILVQEQNEDGSWTTIATLGNTASSYTVSGLTSGQAYNFQVIEAGTDGTGPESSVSYSGTGSPPVVTKVSGDAQSVDASSFAPNPLVASVTDSAGHPLPGVSVTFAVADGSDGELALTSGGTVSTTENVSTDANGQAQVFYEASSDALQINSVTAAVSSEPSDASVAFSESCGIQSGLAIWFTADTGVVTSGTSVTQWNDQSPNQYNVSQSAGSGAPTVGTDSESGDPVVSFNGNQWLAMTSQVSGVDDVTIITVASATNTSSNGTLVAVGTNGFSTSSRTLNYSGGDLNFAVGLPGVLGGAVPSNSALNVNTVTYSRSSQAVSFYSQGVADGTATLNSSDLSTGLTVGSSFASEASNAWNGNIAEIIVYNRVLTDTEREAVEVQLADQYLTYAPGATWIEAYDTETQTAINMYQWDKATADEYVATPDAPVITSALSASATARTTFSYQITASNDPTSFNATGLPPGLSVDTTSGIISGTLTADGITNISLTASNIRGTSTPANLVLSTTGDVDLAQGASVDASSSDNGGVPGNAIDGDLTTGWLAGDSGDFQWITVDLGQDDSIDSIILNWGEEPVGMSYLLQVSNDNETWQTVETVTNDTGSNFNEEYDGLNTSGRYVRLYGTEGSYSSEFDPGSYYLYEFQIIGLPGGNLSTLTSASSATGVVGTAFSYQIAAGNSPTGYAATELPPGLTVDSSSGAITGTPTSAGTYVTTLTTNNANGSIDAQVSFTIYAAVPPLINGGLGMTLSAELEQPLSYQIPAANGPTGYSATGLPSGLSIDGSSGAISGTPTQAGTFTAVVTASNSSGSQTASLTLNVFDPLTVSSGLVGWMDAGSGITNPADGFVTGWTDRAGVQGTLTADTDSTVPTLAKDPFTGNPLLVFSESDYLQGPEGTFDGTELTIIAVASSTSGSSGGWYNLLSYGDATLEYRNGYVIYNDGAESYGITGGPVPSDGELAIDTSTYDATTATGTLYSNGILLGSQVETVDEPSEGQFNVGTYYNTWQGDIAEILIYNRVLSQADQESAELYLAAKYNLPYSAQLGPTISPNGGSDPSSITVSIAGGPAVCIRYTLDGTAPTTDSSSYTGPLTLTDSRIVTAAFFINNVQVSPTSSAQFYVADTGNIGISDAWQIEYFGETGIDPNALSPGGSGLTNLQAYLYGYDPTKFSTNGDGLSDLVNHQLGYAGDNYDINGDGLTNAEDLADGLDPFDSGVTPPPTSPPVGTPGDTVPPTITLVSPQGATLEP